MWFSRANSFDNFQLQSSQFIFTLLIFFLFKQIIVSISLLSANPFPIYNVGSLFLKQIRFECVNHAQKLGVKLTETSFELLQIWFLRLLFNVTDKSVKIITKISNSLLKCSRFSKKGEMTKEEWLLIDYILNQ